MSYGNLVEFRPLPDDSGSARSIRPESSRALELAVVVPTLDERENIAPVLAGLRKALVFTWKQRPGLTRSNA